MYYDYLFSECIFHRYYKLSNYLLKDSRINYLYARYKMDYLDKKMIESLVTDIRMYPSVNCISFLYRRDLNNLAKYLLKDIRIIPSAIRELICCYRNNKKTSKLQFTDIRQRPSEELLSDMEIEEICTKDFGKYLLKYNKKDINYCIPVIISASNEAGAERTVFYTLLKDIRINISIYIDKFNFGDLDNDMYLMELLMNDSRTNLPQNTEPFDMCILDDVRFALNHEQY